VVTGRFLQSSIDDLRSVFAGCLEAPYHFLKAVVPPMVERGDGQVLVVTSASVRDSRRRCIHRCAQANHLVRNVAAGGPHGVR
jgi:NADP-dependent 3-hydroxy acid dehydrogenase YdfG